MRSFLLDFACERAKGKLFNQAKVKRGSKSLNQQGYWKIKYVTWVNEYGATVAYHFHDRGKTGSFWAFLEMLPTE